MISLTILLDVKNILIMAVTVLHAALGVVIPLRGPNRKQNFIFALLELSLIAWSVSMIFYRSSSGSEAVFWTQMLYITALFIPYTFIYFLYTFPHDELDKIKKIFHLILILPIIFFFWKIFSNTFILGVIPRFPEPTIVFDKTIEYLYMFYIVGYFSWGYLRLFYLYKISSDITRVQLRALLIGTLIPTLLGTPGNLFLPLFNIFTLNWSGQVVIGLMAVAIAYSIVKYNLLNVKVIATEVFTVLINIFILIRLLGSESIRDFYFNGSLLLGVGIFSILLIRGVMREVRIREERERLAKDLEKANEDLKKLDAAKSEFISIAGHQLRTPLTVIKGYSSMLLEGSFGEFTNKKITEAIRRIFVSSDTLTKLVSDLLDLSRIESGRFKYEFKKVYPDDIMERAIKGLEELSKERGIKIEFKNENHKTFGVLGDTDKLFEAVMNLLDNALKYSKVGPITVTLRAKSNTLLLSVADKGMGIPKEEIPKLFIKFGRTEMSIIERPDGMGLGLYFVKKIIDDHKGKIWVESLGLGHGSTFFIELPVNRDLQYESFLANI